jgi:hypothetical protein
MARKCKGMKEGVGMAFIMVSEFCLRVV